MDAEQMIEALHGTSMSTVDLRKALAKALEALGHYADDENWTVPIGIPGGYSITWKDATDDGSSIAGIALQEVEDALGL